MQAGEEPAFNMTTPPPPLLAPRRIWSAWPRNPALSTASRASGGARRPLEARIPGPRRDALAASFPPRTPQPREHRVAEGHRCCGTRGRGGETLRRLRLRGPASGRSSGRRILTGHGSPGQRRHGRRRRSAGLGRARGVALPAAPAPPSPPAGPAARRAGACVCRMGSGGAAGRCTVQKKNAPKAEGTRTGRPTSGWCAVTV